jgi:hypothetical protein
MHLHNEGASWFVLLVQCYFSNQATEDEMGGACIMYGGEKKCIQRVTLEGKGPLGRHRHRWIFKWINGGLL